MDGAFVPIIIIPLVLLTQFFLASRCDWRCENCGHVFSLSPVAATLMPHRPVGRKLARCPNCGVSLMGLSRAEAIDAFGIRAPPVLAIVETSSVDFPSDPGLVAVALRFGVAPDALLGQGGEAWVYALDDERVLRVLRDGGRQADVLRRMALVEELALSRPVYRLPEVLDVGEIEGRTYAIERRLPGRSMLEELGRIEGAARERLIEAYLDTSASLGDLDLPAHAGFGDLIADDSIVAPTWRAYLEERAARNLTRSTPELRQVDPAGIADGLPDASTPSFVHLDAFAGNFLTDGVRITAVIDIGASSLAGDRRLDPIASTVYLSDPHVTPTATAHDVDVALAWLRTEGLAEWLEPGRRWLAAYWSFEVDDPKAIAWCSDVLLRSQPII